jgi:hypothetical protein
MARCPTDKPDIPSTYVSPLRLDLFKALHARAVLNKHNPKTDKYNFTLLHSTRDLEAAMTRIPYPITITDPNDYSTITNCLAAWKARSPGYRFHGILTEDQFQVQDCPNTQTLTCTWTVLVGIGAYYTIPHFDDLGCMIFARLPDWSKTVKYWLLLDFKNYDECADKVLNKHDDPNTSVEALLKIPEIRVVLQRPGETMLLPYGTIHAVVTCRRQDADECIPSALLGYYHIDPRHPAMHAFVERYPYKEYKQKYQKIKGVPFVKRSVQQRVSDRKRRKVSYEE